MQNKKTLFLSPGLPFPPQCIFEPYTYLKLKEYLEWKIFKLKWEVKTPLNDKKTSTFQPFFDKYFVLLITAWIQMIGTSMQCPNKIENER